MRVGAVSSYPCMAPKWTTLAPNSAFTRSIARDTSAAFRSSSNSDGVAHRWCFRSDIPWPRVRGLECRGASGLWVNDELVRAIRTGSAEALKHWFGVGTHAAWQWRRAFGVGGHATTPGSRKAIRAAAIKGAAGTEAKEWTDAELDARAEAARERGQGSYLRPRWTPGNGAWPAGDVALLGTADDAVVAEKLGRTTVAVRLKRVKLKIPAFRDRRRR
jgi:hypothetical protein